MTYDEFLLWVMCGHDTAGTDDDPLRWAMRRHVFRSWSGPQAYIREVFGWQWDDRLGWEYRNVQYKQPALFGTDAHRDRIMAEMHLYTPVHMTSVQG